jgi:glycosyltransferase involved in cell wall biosynthesis
MKILVSAFACAPGIGSEAGVGWFWSHEWAKDHEVVVVTDITRQPLIEAGSESSDKSRGPKFVYFRPPWLRWLPLNSWTAQILFQLWQIGLVPFARRLHREHRFDLVHHATYGVFRQPSLLGRLGVPLVFGPVGGGEDAPWTLKRSMPPRNKAIELIRTALNRWARIDPLLRHGLSRTSLILAKTAATAKALPKGFENKIRVALEIGTIPRLGIAPGGRPLNLLYAGKLLAWKGMHLGLRAMAHSIASGADLRITIIGGGPMYKRLRVLARDLKIEDRVEWIDRLPQQELFSRYATFDALIFPSLHDSSGNVVVEALSFGLPVVCFDLGGPADIVTPQSGLVVGTANLSEEASIAAMGAALTTLWREPAVYEALSLGALQRSAELDWESQATRIRQWALQCVNKPADDAAVSDNQ